MRAVRYALLWSAAAAGFAGCGPAGAPGPEAQWARGVADDFWKAFLNDREEQAAALLSPELAKTLATWEYPGVGANWRPVEKPADVALHRLARGFGPGVSVTTESVGVAPDRGEVVLKGSLTGTNRLDEKTAADFTMRVAREGVGGKWGIRYLLITERKQAPGKGP